MKTPFISSGMPGWDKVRLSYWENAPLLGMNDEEIEDKQAISIYCCSCDVSGRADIHIVPAGHCYRFVQHSGSLLVIEIAHALVDEIAYESGFGLTGSVEIRHKVQLQDEKLWQLGRWMLEEVKNEGVNGPAYRDALAKMTVLHLLQNYASHTRSAPAPSRSAQRQISDVIQYMRENLDSDIPLSQLASVAHISLPHLIRLFKKQTGYTPHQYFIRMRVERSKALIRHGRESLKAIASRTGFADQGHFTRIFKRLTGITPLQYAGEVVSKQNGERVGS